MSKNIIIFILIGLVIGLFLLYKFLPGEVITNTLGDNNALTDTLCAVPVKVAGDSMEPLFKNGVKTNFTKCFEQNEIQIGTVLMFKDENVNRLAVVKNITDDQIALYQPNHLDRPINNITFENIIAIYSQKYTGANQIETQKQDTTTPKQTSDYQTFSNDRFTYQCPAGWYLGDNKNYNAQIDLSECSKIYSGEYAFDDGISLTFGFVPQGVADNYKWNNEKWSGTLLNEVKNEENVEPYSNNNFTGWISGKNERHTLKLIARYPVEGGYYEMIANVAGDTKTEAEFKQMIDEIISSFKVK